MKKIITFLAISLLAGCKGDGTGNDQKNEGENYPTYDTTSQMENINKGGTDNSLAEPSNADRNHTSH